MATIYVTLLGRGYFPKELPPAFFTQDFARYATSQLGRVALTTYAPSDKFTEPVRYRLALPGQGGLASRPLSIPHPWAFSALARVVAQNFRRLLTKSGASGFAKSRPVYAAHNARALTPLVKPSNLSRERANSRAGATHLLKVDISQFYPALYTHAVGWAIDPKLRKRRYWNNNKLLGKQVDQLLMNMQGKVSQGVPIGNDLSFLFAETVLAAVDKGLKLAAARTYRWFDDYEIACTSRQEAEETLVALNRLLDSFRLRVNPKKTHILELPEPAGDGWQDELRALSRRAFGSTANMVSYFDHAFRARLRHSEQAVLLYAIGTLFKVRTPLPAVRKVAESCITQALLAEPGCAQKAFALLTFWEANAAPFERAVVSSTIDRLIQMHESRGASSDVAWALAFCIEHRVTLAKSSSRLLAKADDDAVCILALHANELGLLPGFSTKVVTQMLQRSSCDGEHWLLLYESVRQNFLPSLRQVVTSNPLFSNLLARGVSFYRKTLPHYALLVHPGGAPEWVVTAWLKAARVAAEADVTPGDPVVQMLSEDVGQVGTTGKTFSDILRELIDNLTEHPTAGLEPYE